MLHLRRFTIIIAHRDRYRADDCDPILRRFPETVSRVTRVHWTDDPPHRGSDLGDGTAIMGRHSRRAAGRLPYHPSRGGDT
jgi:hypothetical protein